MATSMGLSTDAIEMPPQALLSALSTSPHVFLQPSSTLHSSAILAVKRFLDPLASNVSSSQTERRKDLRRKRKRSVYEDGEEQVLQLTQICTDGFDMEQIWEQAKRVLDAAHTEVARGLAEVQALKESGELNGADGATSADAADKSVQFDDMRKGESMSEDYSEEEIEINGVDDYVDEESDLQVEEGLQVEEDLSEDIEMDEDGSLDDDDAELRPSGTYIQDPNGLNDGFFSIDDFNRQSQFREQQDARGDPDDGAASDEEDLDWDADPLTGGMAGVERPSDKNVQIEDEEEADDEEDGPTFGNADLHADSADEKGMDDGDDAADDGAFSNTNDIMYKDFFDPPPQKPSKTKRTRALPKTQPPKEAQAEGLQEDIQRAVADVRRDIFDEELSEESSDEDNGAAAKMSTHEKQKVKLMAEIRRLEAAAVAKRDWTLSGEARASDRPINSVLEEDLEFERTGKPVPVITNEVSEEIEALIRRRILARDFDEVLRRRPEISGSRDVRRGQVEVDDSKPHQSLAEVYETEYLRANDPSYVGKRDEKLKKEHAEINRLWKDISDKLDLLSNWNYKPKIPEANVTVVADTPTITLEDARPNIAVGMNNGLQSTLAPQEIYAPGYDGEKTKGEVLLKGGSALSKEEMSREEKLRRRRREKERSKKRGENRRALEANYASAATADGKSPRKNKKDEKKNILEDLKRGGVKVIGKKGELTNVDGKKSKDTSGLVSSASAFKL